METKARVFAFIIYPDSSPADWRDCLEKLGLPVAVSPRHDKDKMEKRSAEAIRKEAERRAQEHIKAHGMVYGYKESLIAQLTKEQEENEFKKVHRHGIIVHNNTISRTGMVKKLQRALGETAVNSVQIVDNIEGAYLYLTHESPDAIKKKKHVYDKKDIVLINNFDIARYITMDREQKKTIVRVLISITREKGFLNINDMHDYIDGHVEEFVKKANGLSADALPADEIMEVAWDNIRVLRAYFDANYQRRIWKERKESESHMNQIANDIKLMADGFVDALSMLDKSDRD